ncbi:MAG TPA: hypothetical protein VFE23_12360 [Usitatibacter sp.]|jgi:hypothetical protein|nr:hypothetical protein [Usitatibacter sp.]
MRYAALVVAGFIVATGAWGADRACSKADAANAQKAIDRVMTWPQLRKAYQDFGQCDSGDAAEGFSDALLRLLVDWQDVPALASSMSDPAFKQFVLGHLRGASKEDRDAVYSRAKASCPPAQQAFCGEIADAAKAK